VLNNIFLISFDLFDFEHNQIEGDFLQKRAVSEGVFKYQYQFQNNLNA
jgi:hypothetical protein